MIVTEVKAEAVEKCVEEGVKPRIQIDRGRILINKYEIPEETCPVIDEAQRKLNEVREANEQLRSACSNYYRDNRGLGEYIQRLLAQIKDMQFQLSARESLTEFVNNLVAGQLPAVSQEIYDLALLKAKVLEQEELINELLPVRELCTALVDSINCSGASMKVRRNLNDEQISKFDTFKQDSNKRRRALRKAALGKLSETEKEVLGIYGKSDTTEEDDDDS